MRGIYQSFSWVFVVLCFASVLSVQSQDWMAYIQKQQYSQAIPLLLEQYKREPDNLLVLLNLGQAYLKLEHYDSARIYLERAYRKERRNSEVVRLYSIALANIGEGEKALDLLRRQLKRDENNPYLYLALGEVYILMDSLPKADYAIRKALQINPNIIETYIALGDLYYAQKVYPLAEQYYLQAIQKDSLLIVPRIKLAQVYYSLAARAANPQQATQYYRKAYEQWDILTRLDSTNPKPFLEKGKLLYYARQYGAAIQPLQKYLEMNPNDQEAQLWLAHSLYEVRRCDQAVTIYSKLLPTLKDSLRYEVVLRLARCAYFSKDYSKAVEWFDELMKKSIGLESDDWEYYGYALMNIGDTARAVQTLLQVIETDSTKCRLMFTLGNFLREQKMYEQSIAVLKRRLQYCDDTLNSRVYLLIGIAYFSLPQLDSSEVYLRKAVAVDSTLIYAKVQLANVYLEKEQPEMAKEILFNVIQDIKKDTAKYRNEIESAFGMLCSIYSDQKDYKRMLELTEEWVRIHPESIYANLFRAVAFHGLQQVEKACQYYRKVLALDPSNNVAKQNVATLRCPD